MSFWSSLVSLFRPRFTADQGGGHLQIGNAPTWLKAARSHDSGMCSWYLNCGPDGSPNLTNIRAWVAYCRSIGITMGLLTLYGTPPAYATSTAPDPYGHAGGGSPPSSNQAAAAWVLAVLTDPGIAGFFVRVEPWDEVVPGFWIGTPQQSVALAAAIRAVLPPGVLLSTPPFTQGQIQAQTWLNTRDPTTGKYGRQLVDTLSFHLYGCDSTNWIANSNGLNAYRAALATAGIPNKQIVVSEWGIASSPTDSRIASFNAMTPAQRTQWLVSFGQSFTANGCIAYSYAYFNGLCGNQQTDSAVQAGLAQITMM